MAEVKRIRQSEANYLRAFLVAENRRENGKLLHLIHDKWITDRNYVAIGIFEGRRIDHLLLTQVIDEKTALTWAFLGKFAPWTRDVLDSLCAVCASYPEPIIQHRFLLKPEQAKEFDDQFKPCRLSRFQARRTENQLDPASTPPDLFIEKHVWKQLNDPRVLVNVLVEYPK